MKKATKKILAFLLCLIMFLPVIPALPALASVSLIDGTFEQYADGEVPNAAAQNWLTWFDYYGGKTVVEAGVSHDGSKALKVTGDGGAGYNVFNLIKPNTTYIFSAWGRTVSGGAASAPVGFKYNSVDNIDEFNNYLTFGAEWEQKSFEFTTPANLFSAEIYVWLNSGVSYIDDVELIEVESGGGEEPEYDKVYLNPALEDFFLIWRTNGVDSHQTDLDIDILKSAKYLVVEFNPAIDHNGFSYILQSSLAWDPFNPSDTGITVNGGAVTVDLTAADDWANIKGNATGIKIFMIDNWWSGDITANYVNSYLLIPKETGGGGGPSFEVQKNSLIINGSFAGGLAPWFVWNPASGLSAGDGYNGSNALLIPADQEGAGQDLAPLKTNTTYYLSCRAKVDGGTGTNAVDAGIQYNNAGTAGNNAYKTVSFGRTDTAYTVKSTFFTTDPAITNTPSAFMYKPASHNMAFYLDEMVLYEAIQKEALPAKLTYAFGEPLDLTGMIIHVYNAAAGDFDKVNVTNGNAAASGYSATAPGEQTVLVTYANTYTAPITVTVNEPAAASAVTISQINGVAAPRTNSAAVTAVTETSQFTGTVTWSPAPAGGKFEEGVSYTAYISLTAKSGYTFDGVAENFFTVAGAENAANPADSGAVTAVFPATKEVKNFTVAGTKILDPDGEEFLMKGVNINGPGWAFSRDTLQDVSLMLDTWLFNSVRLCASKGWLWAQSYNSDLDAIIEAFTSRGIVVMLEMHDWTGYWPADQAVWTESPGQPWGSYRPSIAEMVEWWEDKAERFGGNPYVWFNIMNEPSSSGSSSEAQKWFDIHKLAIDAIRAKGAENIIVLDEYQWGQGGGYYSGPAGWDSAIIRKGPELDALYGNLVYSLHIYDAWRDGAQRFENYFNDAAARDLCVIIGEFGVAENQVGQHNAVMHMYNAVIPRDIGRLYWAWDDGGLPLTTSGGGRGWSITPNDGSKPANLTWVGELVWADTHGTLTAPVPGYDLGLPLLLNGDFESGMSGWADWGNVSVVNGASYNGSRALRVGAGSGGGTGQGLDIKPNTTYRFEAWGYGSADIGIKYNIGPTSYEFHNFLIFRENVWENKFITFTTPAVCTGATLFIWKDGGFADAFYADDLKLSAVEIEELTLKTPPAKLTYQLGDSLDLSGLVLKVDYTARDSDELVYRAVKDEIQYESGAPVTGTGYNEDGFVWSVSGFDSSAPGTKTVTVTYNNISVTFEVTIEAVFEQAAFACAVKTLTASVGVQQTIAYSYSGPESGRPTFASSNPGICAVDGDGVLTPIKAGMAIVTVRCGAVTVTIVVTVK